MVVCAARYDIHASLHQAVSQSCCILNDLTLISAELIGKSFLKSYAAVCLEGAIIVLGCIIFSVFATSPPVVDSSAAAVNQVWSYVGELIFNMIVLVGTVKMADRVVKEMMGL